MICLALEQSTSEAGLVLLRDDAVLAARSWQEARGRNQQLFGQVATALAEAGLGFGDVDQYRVGLGPGGFTGLRIALAAVQAWALPGGRTVYGVPGDAALAARIGRERTAERVAVVGDGRRGRVWIARYAACTEPAPRATDERVLVPCEALAGAVDGIDRIVSPDAARLGEVFVEQGVAVDAAVPSAQDIATLGAAMLAAGADFPPLTPIYLHPPVFVEPRFPA